MEIGAYTVDDPLIARTVEDRAPRVHLYRPTDISVVLGRGSKPEVETHQDAIAADGVALLRRRGGGCAVVIDPGNAILSVVLPTDGLGGSKRAFAQITAWLSRGLAAMGIDGVRQDGISDLARDGRKVGGSCIYQTNRMIYFTTTLLLDPDLALVERYLAHPPREPAYRRGRRHHDFMGRLADAFGEKNTERFVAELGQRLRRAGPLPGVIPEVAQTTRWRISNGGPTLGPGTDPAGGPDVERILDHRIDRTG